MHSVCTLLDMSSHLCSRPGIACAGLHLMSWCLPGRWRTLVQCGAASVGSTRQTAPWMTIAVTPWQRPRRQPTADGLESTTVCNKYLPLISADDCVAVAKLYRRGPVGRARARCVPAIQQDALSTSAMGACIAASGSTVAPVRVALSRVVQTGSDTRSKVVGKGGPKW